MKYKYGISRHDYEALVANQDGRCAICGETQPGRRLSVDHDHSCCPGEKSCGQCIRDLLCVRCNTLLGQVNDKPERLLAAVSYLRKWSK